VNDGLLRQGGLTGFFRFVFAQRDGRLVGAAVLSALTGLGLWLADAPSPIYVAALAAAISAAGLPIAVDAYRELRLRRTLGINLLTCIAVIGAVAIGDWVEAAIVAILFSLGEFLEAYAAERTRGALESLSAIVPDVAIRRLPGGRLQEVPVEELGVGVQVLVRPGDRVTVDGLVVSGRSDIDEAAITGESMPVAKEAGDEVFAGTMNLSAALEVEVSHAAADNTLSRMVALVQEAQSRRAPVERFVERFARVYTPAVAVAAALAAALPPLLVGGPFWGSDGSLARALQILIIACPCALVIGTPVAVVSALASAATRGVLVKGGRYLEALARVGVFAFDKTGTLTEGHPKATDVVGLCSCGRCAEDCGLVHAAALEVGSSHPLAKALLEEAWARGLQIPKAENVSLLSGRGLEGTVAGEPVTVASHAYFDERVPHREEVCRIANQLAEQGKTVVLVRHTDEMCAVFGISDVVRQSARQVIADLRSEGIDSVMLTGDSLPAARQVGIQLGVDELRAGLSPEDKLNAIASLGSEARLVAMVGDGVNDAPALARADVGIALGGAGSAQAMETADVVLMRDDLRELPFIVRLSRRVRGVVRANIALALGVKAAVLVLASLGLATLTMAIVADVGATLAVTLNGMRLREAQ
jgi:Cd2+/Zn2+-exporting ATPase